jgi:hypothetical protein
MKLMSIIKKLKLLGKQPCDPAVINLTEESSQNRVPIGVTVFRRWIGVTVVTFTK